jgi:predicted permease
VLRLFLELLPCLAIGLLLGQRWPLLPGRLAPLLVRWGVPFGLVGLLLRSGLHRNLLSAGLMAAIGTASGLLLIRWLPPLHRQLSTSSLRLGSVVGNTAYWGLPAALALLPAAAIAQAITYDLVATLLTWSLGPLLLEGSPPTAGPVLRGLRDSPASQGLLIALVLQLTPWSGAVAAALWWPARITVLLALTVVGMRLGVMRRERGIQPPTGAGLRLALAMKLVFFPALMLALAGLLRLPALVRDAVVLQAAAPTAVSVLLLSEAAAARKSGLQPAGTDDLVDSAAALVFWGTALALLTVPLWWQLLAGLPG